MENRNLIIGATVAVIIIAGVYLQRQKKVSVPSQPTNIAAIKSDDTTQPATAAASPPPMDQAPQLQNLPTIDTTPIEESVPAKADENESPAFEKLKAAVATASFKAFVANAGVRFESPIEIFDFDLKEFASNVYMFESSPNSKEEVLFVLSFENADLNKMKTALQKSRGADFTLTQKVTDKAGGRMPQGEMGLLPLGSKQILYFAGQPAPPRGVFIAVIQPGSFNPAQIEQFQKALAK